MLPNRGAILFLDVRFMFDRATYPGDYFRGETPRDSGLSQNNGGRFGRQSEARSTRKQPYLRGKRAVQPERHRYRNINGAY